MGQAVPSLHKADGTPRLQAEQADVVMIPCDDHARKTAWGERNIIQDCLRHGVDPEGEINQLTNDIHPIFHTICRCKFTLLRFCPCTHARMGFKMKTEPVPVPEIASPAPSDNYVVRAILQLATRMLTDDSALPFLFGLMEHGKNGLDFHAHPRRHLSAEKKEATLQRLRQHAPMIFIHFREFSQLDASAFKKGSNGYTTRRPRKGVPFHCDIVMDTEKIIGYNFSASRSSCDVLTTGELKRSIICSASTLCHEVVHAFCYLEIQASAEPRFNGERFAEVGHAFENFLLGGKPLADRNGLYLLEWPQVHRLSDYKNMPWGQPIYAYTVDFRMYPPWVEETAYWYFLTDNFWDEKGAESSSRRRKPFKKMWLRPYHEVPTTVDEYDWFSSPYGDVPLRENQAKRRRLADTWGENWRWEDNRKVTSSTTEKSSRMSRNRRKKKMKTRKEEFHARELLRLNQAWVDLLSPFPVNAF